MKYDFKIKEDKIEYFMNLLKKDRFENLSERYKFFASAEPDRFQKKLGFVPIIIRNVWTVIAIRGEIFAFSAGFFYEYGQPEIMVISDSLSSREFNLLINEIYCYVRDKGPVQLGKDYTEEILIKKELELDTDPEDSDLPDSEKRITARNGKEFKLINVSAPLIFNEYTRDAESSFPCEYLRSFYRNFADTEDFPMIYADLR